MIKTLKLIEGAYKSPRLNSFIAGFAKPLIFANEIKTLNPMYLFLRFQSIKDALDAGLISNCFKVDENGKQENVNLLSFIDANSKLFKLDKYDTKTYKSGTTAIRINVNSISFKDPAFEEINISFDGSESVTFQQYINFQQQFLVTFDKPDYAYTHRKIFQDHRLLEDVDIFMNTFIGDPLLSKVTSEKGKTNKASTDFPPKTIFNYVETTYLPNVDCMICDDMGTEWGDHITISGDEICFYHSKYGKPGLSASKLEVVFGQAQKI